MSCKSFEQKNLLDIAIKASIQAGREILKLYDNNIQVEYKKDNSPLTMADQNANEIIVKYLKTTNIPIISEENKSTPYVIRKDWDILWLVDPLDGTKEFIRKNGEFTVNIALIQKGIPVLGVIYVPAKRILYYGDKDGGFMVGRVFSYSDVAHSKHITLKPKESTSNVILVSSRSHKSEETNHFIQRVKSYKNVRDVTTMSVGSSLKMCMVAEGKADIYPRFAPTMEWDIAAGHAICRAVGIRVLQVNNQSELTYNKPDLKNPWFVVGDRFGTTAKNFNYNYAK